MGIIIASAAASLTKSHQGGPAFYLNLAQTILQNPGSIAALKIPSRFIAELFKGLFRHTETVYRLARKSLKTGKPDNGQTLVAMQ
jgi:hypothetical protein